MQIGPNVRCTVGRSKRVYLFRRARLGLTWVGLGCAQVGYAYLAYPKPDQSRWNGLRGAGYQSQIESDIKNA